MIRILSKEERYDIYRSVVAEASTENASAIMYDDRDDCDDCNNCGSAPETITRENTNPFVQHRYEHVAYCACKFGEPASSEAQAKINWKNAVSTYAAYARPKRFLWTTVATAMLLIALPGAAHAMGGLTSQGADIPFFVNMDTAVGDWTATALSVYGETDSTLTGTGNFRMLPQAAPAGIGSFFRNDGTNTSLLLTNPGDSLGAATNLQPFAVNDVTGTVVLDATGTGMVGINNPAPQAELDVIGNAQTSGSMTALYYAHTSDIRLKSDIVQIPDALDRVMQLRGVTFTWNTTGQRDMGVIAQEVEEVFPDIVHTNSQGVKSVEYDALIAPAIGAIQELKADNNQLRTEVTAIEARLDVLNDTSNGGQK